MPTIRVRALVVKDDARHASTRTVGEVTSMFKRVNEIWKQAEVSFEVKASEWRTTPEKLDGLVQAASLRQGDTDSIRDVTGTDPHHVTAIYVRSIGGSNGKVFRPKRTVLVVDNTKMPDYRTTAHEIGHLFGLEHWLDTPPPAPPDRPPNHLMARTQPGTELIPRDVSQVRNMIPTSGFDLY